MAHRIPSKFCDNKKNLLIISCKIFSWIGMKKLKMHTMEFCDIIKDFVSPSGLFVPRHWPWRVLGDPGWQLIVQSQCIIKYIIGHWRKCGQPNTTMCQNWTGIGLIPVAEGRLFVLLNPFLNFGLTIRWFCYIHWRSQPQDIIYHQARQLATTPPVTHLTNYTVKSLI